MPEGQAVHKAETPATVESLQADFDMHSVLKSGWSYSFIRSLSAMGWVCVLVQSQSIIALQEVLGETGTLVMPTHSTDLSDPSQLGKPARP